MTCAQGLLRLLWGGPEVGVLRDCHSVSLNLHLTGRYAAKRDQPFSCASRQKSLGTTAMEFKITIILMPHLVPPALVFRTPG